VVLVECSPFEVRCVAEQVAAADRG